MPVHVNPLATLYKVPASKNSMNNKQAEYFNKKNPHWNCLILNTPSVQWNFGVEVYEIDLFFYVYIYAKIFFLPQNHKLFYTHLNPIETKYYHC